MSDGNSTICKKMKNYIEVSVKRKITDIHLWYHQGEWRANAAVVTNKGREGIDRDFVAEAKGKTAQKAFENLMDELGL